MSTVTYPLYIDPMEIADYLHELLSQNAGPLGLAYVGTGDSLIPEYPAAIVSPGGKAKEIHTTRKFNVIARGHRLLRPVARDRRVAARLVGDPRRARR